MEYLELLIGFASFVGNAIGTGALAKIGENMADKTPELARQVWMVLQRQASGTETVKALEAGREIDYQQAVIDLEPLARDPEVERMLEEIKKIMANNEEFAAKIETAIRDSQRRNTQINRDKSQGYQFNDEVNAKFIGGIHYHGKDGDKPD